MDIPYCLGVVVGNRFLIKIAAAWPQATKVEPPQGQCRINVFYVNIAKEQFVVSVTYSDSTKNNKVLRVQLIQHPKNIYEIEYTPNFVEFINEQHD